MDLESFALNLCVITAAAVSVSNVLNQFNNRSLSLTSSSICFIFTSYLSLMMVDDDDDVQNPNNFFFSIVIYRCAEQVSVSIFGRMPTNRSTRLPLCALRRINGVAKTELVCHLSSGLKCIAILDNIHCEDDCVRCTLKQLYLQFTRFIFSIFILSFRVSFLFLLFSL